MKLYVIKMSFLFIFFEMLTIEASAQFHDRRSIELKANSRWFMGDLAINFNQDPPEITKTPEFYFLYKSYEIPLIDTDIFDFVTIGPGMRFYNSVPVSDPQSGQLRFIALRNTLYDRNLNPMPNGEYSEDLYDKFAYQQCIAVAPVVYDPDQYYFFNISGSLGLTCSLVNMNLNNGLGDIDTPKKNIVIQKPQLADPTMSIAGIVPGNNCDYWLVLAENTALLPVVNMYSVHVTVNGIDPVVASYTLPKGDKSEMQWDFQFCPNRDMLSFISYRPEKNNNTDPETKIRFLKFNLEDGSLSQSPIPDIDLNLQGAGFDVHGSFTPDNQFYVAYKNDYINGQVVMYKYELAAAVTGYNIITLPYTLPYWLLGAKVRDKYIPPVLYFKPYNNKLFFNIPYSFRVPSVSEPGRFNIYSNSIIKMSDIEPETSGSWNTVRFGPELPFSFRCRLFTNHNVIYPYPPGDTVATIATDSVMCFDPSLIFPTLTLQAKPGFDSYVWNDGSTGSTHTIKQAGKYWVYYKGSCNTRVDTFIYRYRAPEHILQPDTVPCEERFPIEITADAATWYQWDDNSTQQKRTIYHPGTYSVQFERWGCRQFDTITIGSKHCPCNISVPNAFTPNGDGLNDFFKPSIALGCVPSEYSFRILNRWGQIVYGSFNEFDQGWDGTYKGGTADAGTYIYELRFKSRFLEEPYYKKGELILVR